MILSTPQTPDNICQFIFCFGIVIVLWKETCVVSDGPEPHLDGWMDKKALAIHSAF